MRKEVKITVPNDWSAISLRKYLQIQDDLTNYKDDEDAQSAFLLYHLCGLTPEITSRLDVDTIGNIKEDLQKLLNKQDYELTRLVKIQDTEWGFEPNLAKMPYGAYLDISKFETLSIDKNWPTIMSILYREVTKKAGALYDIKPHKGVSKEDQERWLDVSMDVHFSTFFFLQSYLQGLIERYPEIFEGGSIDAGDAASTYTANFARKWRGYQSIAILAGENILKFDEVTQLPLETCLLNLCYISDKVSMEKAIHKASMRKYKK